LKRPPVFSIEFCTFAVFGLKTGAHGTANDPKADELYTAVLQEIDLDKAKQLWTEFKNYAKEMWINVGIVKVYDHMVLSDQVDPNDWLELHVILYDALSSIKQKTEPFSE